MKVDEVRIMNKIRSSDWISTEYTNHNSPGNLYLISNGQGAGFDQSFWSNYHRITIPAYILDEDLEDFPVYVNLADLPASFFTTVQANGADIRITKSDQDTQQAFELVNIDTANGTGELWFKAELLSSNQDNVFYIYYGNPLAEAYSRSDEFGSEQVWSNNFSAVYHMNQDPTGLILDSTKNRNNANSSGSMTSGDLVLSKMGKAIDFDGINDYLISTSNSGLSGTNRRTLSLWYDNDNIANLNSTSLIRIGNLATNQLFEILNNATSKSLTAHWYGGGNNFSGLAPSADNNETFTSIRYDGTNIDLFQNERLIGTRATVVATTNTQISLARQGFAGHNFFDGTIDEVKISNIDRSKNWLWAEYLNQKSTNKFYYIDSGNRINDSLWSHHYKITIPASEINGDLTDFPVYLNLADLPNDFFTTVNGQGADIRITTSDMQTQTAFELVEIDTANGTGELWFKANLSSSVDNIFYLHAGNATAEAYADDHLFGAQNVWSNGFAAVYHMNENPSGLIKDSTKYSNDGTSTGAMTSDDLIRGKVSKAIDFDGINDSIGIGKPLSSFGSLTVCTWVKDSIIGAGEYVIAQRGAEGIGWWELIGRTNGYRFEVKNSSATEYYSPKYSTTDGQWHNMCGYFSSLQNRVGLYADGTIIGQSPTSGVPAPIVDTAINNITAGGGFPQKSIQDEIQISNVVRSQDWVSTEYKNQNSPGNFYLIENGNIAGFDPTLWSNKYKITIPAAVINGDLENFPVYVDLADLPLSFFGTVQGSGADIRITKADQKTQLAFELVELNTVNKTGELWFKADSLSSTQENIFYLWFGNPNAQAYSRIDEFGTENVWTEGYVGVWHINEDPDMSNYKDSSSYHNDGIATNLSSDDPIISKLGKAVNLDGSSESILIPTSSSLTTLRMTLSAWFKTDSTSFAPIIEYNTGGAPGVHSWYNVASWGGSGTNFIDTVSTHHVIDDGNLSGVNTSTWYYHSSSYDGNNGRFLLNGILEDNSILGNFTPKTDTNLYLGLRPNSLIYFNGTIDEVRISNMPKSIDWVKTEYLNQKDTGVFYTIDNGSLNNNTWSNLFKITILASQVNGDLTDFPVYVNLADLPSDFFNLVNGSGADIRITSSDRKTQTAFELVSLDIANGQGELWFKAPFLSSTTDTDFYLFVGNPNAKAYSEDHLFGAQNVWSNGFVAVYHMNEDPSTGAGAIKDSTRHNNNGTSLGSMITSDLVTGHLGKAIDFDGTNDYLNTSLDPLNEVGTNMTISGWAYSRVGNNYRGIAGGHVGSFQGLVFGQHESGNIHFGFGNSVNWGHAVYTSENLNSWSTYTMLVKAGLGVELFKNGINVGSDLDGATISNINNFWIGRAYNAADRYFNGVIDEIRVSRVTRSTDWIKTEYNNHNSPATFYTTEKINRASAVMFGRMF